MATTWMGAAMQKILTPRVGAVAAAAEHEVARRETEPRRARGWRTPEGVASWLAFHGIDARRLECTTPGRRRSV